MVRNISIYFSLQWHGQGQLASPGKLIFQREQEKAWYSMNQVEVTHKWACKWSDWSKVLKFTVSITQTTEVPGEFL